MTPHREDIEGLLSEAFALEDGPARLAALTEAAELADSHHDLELGMWVRDELMNTALGCGQAKPLTVAFSWCLTQLDRHPEEFCQYDVLWKYRWVISELASLPDVPRRQLEEMFGDMADRYRRAGASARPVQVLRGVVARITGDTQVAVAAHAAWRKLPRDEYADDAETERAFTVFHHLFMRRPGLALRVAQPMLQRGFLAGHFEATVCSRLLLSLLRMDRRDLAAECQRRSIKHIRNHPRYIEEIGQHILYLTLIGDAARAVRLMDRRMADALTIHNYEDRFEFWRGCTFLMEHLAERKRMPIRLRLPPQSPLFDLEGAYDAARLAEQCRTQLLEIAKRFDARNGNDYFARRAAELGELEKHARI